MFVGWWLEQRTQWRFDSIIYKLDISFRRTDELVIIIIVKFKSSLHASTGWTAASQKHTGWAAIFEQHSSTKVNSHLVSVIYQFPSFFDSLGWLPLSMMMMMVMICGKLVHEVDWRNLSTTFLPSCPPSRTVFNETLYHNRVFRTVTSKLLTKTSQIQTPFKFQLHTDSKFPILPSTHHKFMPPPNIQFQCFRVALGEVVHSGAALRLFNLVILIII